MAYQTPITVKEALARIHRHDYVLPAIQREFVWEQDQVSRLFDSLLRGYPIGTFLFWNVRPELVPQFQFYDVMREYHEVKHRHSLKLPPIEGRPIVAVLDGQQRLSSLNIGLCGSYTVKQPRTRASSPDAYPSRRLHLDLCHRASEDDDTEYRFEFLADAEVGRRNGAGEEHWYPVSEVLSLPDQGPAIFTYVQAAGLANHSSAFQTLAALWHAVHVNPVISFFEEEEQDLAKVLDIFVRVNSGGTVLSKSDLLLSIATAEFQERDARESVHGLVDDLNATPPGFNVSKDLVLKSGLVLAVGRPEFRVESFTKANMAALDRCWDDIDHALRVAVRVLASFGLSARTLSAASVLIPLADYVERRRLDLSYITARHHAPDARVLRSWVMRSLVRPGVWGSGLDGLINALHAVIGKASDRFPVEDVEAAMTRLGKSLIIDEALLDDIVDTPYRNKRIFPLLALLYPGVDTSQEFHEDHVFPKSLFTRSRLTKSGVSHEFMDEFLARVDRLPNLQLLQGQANLQKSAMLPLDWVRERFPDAQARNGWLAANDMHDLPTDVTDFLDFYEARRARMKERLRTLLVPGSATFPASAPGPASASAHVHGQAGGAGGRTESEVDEQPRARRHIGVTIADLLRLGRLRVGDQLHVRFRGSDYSVEVLPDGRLRSGNEVFETPSQAARLLTDQVAVNGWIFWKTASGEAIGDLR